MAKNHHDDPDLHGGRLRVPRSRGAFSGVLLLILGIWGALIPFVGPYVDFGYQPDSAFDLTRARFWLELLPGVVTAVGGFLLLVAANRVVTSLGAWLAVAGGAWFLVGPTLDRLLHLGTIEAPIHTSTLGSTLEQLLLFTGIGSLILLLGALAVGRLGVVSVRDVRAAQRRERERDDDTRDDRPRDDRPRDYDDRVDGRRTRTVRDDARYDENSPRPEPASDDGVDGLRSAPTPRQARGDEPRQGR